MQLRRAVEARQGPILSALKKDLGKSEVEGYLSEIGFTLSEIDFALKHLKGWMKPRKVPTPAVHHPARSYILPEPYGRVLIIAPWNYPFQLLLSPLIGAVAAGNCVVLKPSEIAPHTAAAVADLIRDRFDDRHIAVVEGGVETVQALLEIPFDHIFFTGSTSVGRIVMKAAAQQPTPVTLELGGKSPCIVHSDAPLKTTARRIVWGKFMNAGQTCIAPDYLYVHESVKEGLLEEIASAIRDFYGPEPEASPHYGRIINDRHYQRLMGLMDGATIHFGGHGDAESRFIAPTVMTGTGWDHPAMEEEIFGPLLPVLTYTDLSDVVRQIADRPNPLALYVFSRDRRIYRKLVTETASGGVCINDTIAHIVTPHLPFGGVGRSGMGRYHGRYSFETFSHRKSVMKRSLLIDPSLRYPPYPVPLRMLKNVMRWIL